MQPHQSVSVPEFQRHLLYSNCVQRGEYPLSQFIPGIHFLPPISNDLFDLTIYFANAHHNSDKFIDVPLYTRNMKDFLIYYEMKKLEKDLSDRLVGRVANGFRKVVNSFPITKCSKEVFEQYFAHYKDYCLEKERQIIGYDRLGFFLSTTGLSYSFEYPFLPSFANRHWTLNEYSILVDEHYQPTKVLTAEELEMFPDWGLFCKHLEVEADFEEGWEHYRNMVYRLTVTHNPITEIVTVSFAMQSMRLSSDMTYKQTL